MLQISPEVAIGLLTIVGSVIGGYFGANMAIKVQLAILETKQEHMIGEQASMRRRLHRHTANLGAVNAKLNIDYDIEG